ncbi:Uncharacterised protein [Vibrio cholerae]|nr:Uncharacterised protein [Vibrio cholerae]
MTSLLGTNCAARQPLPLQRQVGRLSYAQIYKPQKCFKLFFTNM